MCNFVCCTCQLPSSRCAIFLSARRCAFFTVCCLGQLPSSGCAIPSVAPANYASESVQLLDCACVTMTPRVTTPASLIMPLCHHTCATPAVVREQLTDECVQSRSMRKKLCRPGCGTLRRVCDYIDEGVQLCGRTCRIVRERVYNSVIVRV